MALQQVARPGTVAAVATKVDGFWVVDVVVDGDLLAVRVESLDDVDEAVNTELMRGPLATGRQVRVHIYAYQ